MRLSEYASTRKTRGSYKMPRSVQQSIPIDRIYADGVWQSENVFSLMWQISDINYAMQSDAAKQNILTQLGTVYAGIPADCWMQVCIVSQRMDEKAFARDVLYHRENDGFDALRAERNRQIKANARENGNVVQHKYIIVSTNKPGVKEARERFVQVQGHLLSAFSALECAVTPLDNRARLEVLHKFFRISEEGRFNFDFDNCAKLGQDFRDSIAPDCIRFCKKHIEIEDFYAKCMTISEYPQQLDDKFISALLQQVPYIVLSIDIEPVETEDAFKEIDNAQMKTDAEKVRFNKKSVENLDFTSSVPQRTQEQDRIIASIRKEMTENDQHMPNIISAVALATMWIQYVFNYDYGLLNQIVKAFGGENVRWLGTDLIFWAMMIAFIFGSVGYYMLIFISGIEGIPQDLYEAATIDGANILDRFFQITLPLLKGVIRTCVTFWSINATTFFLWTKMFSPINTETATIVPVVYLYDTVFGGKGVVERDAGAGAAVGVVLTLIIIAVYVITNLILKDSDLEY